MKNVGLLGELIAARYLESRGYRICVRQFRVRGGEIDLIATHMNALIFVEVKTRTQDGFGAGVESLTVTKKKTLKRAMHEFLFRFPEQARHKTLRWDVIELRLDTKKRKILGFTHYKNVHL